MTSSVVARVISQSASFKGLFRATIFADSKKMTLGGGSYFTSDFLCVKEQH